MELEADRLPEDVPVAEARAGQEVVHDVARVPESVALVTEAGSKKDRVARELGDGDARFVAGKEANARHVGVVEADPADLGRKRADTAERITDGGAERFVRTQLDPHRAEAVV